MQEDRLESYHLSNKKMAHHHLLVQPLWHLLDRLHSGFHIIKCILQFVLMKSEFVLSLLLISSSYHHIVNKRICTFQRIHLLEKTVFNGHGDSHFLFRHLGYYLCLCLFRFPDYFLP